MRTEKRFVKRLVGLMLAAAVLLSSVSCNFDLAENTQVKFDRFIENLPQELVSDDSLDLEFLFENPENFGFERELPELPFHTMEESVEGIEEIKELLNELKSFSYQDLTEEQKLTYAVFADYFTRMAPSEKSAWWDNNYLGSLTSFQAQLPLLLSEYTFETKHDLESYFHILKTSPKTFLEYAKNEKRRQEKGIGMSRERLDATIEQCENFLSEEKSFVVDIINKKIDQVDFLNEQEKENAKKQNEELIPSGLLEAYRVLEKELKTITTDKESVGLAKQPGGKEYYEYIVRSQVGLDDSIEEIHSYLTNQGDRKIMEMEKIFEGSPDLLDQFLNTPLVYTTLDGFEANIDYLQERMKEDFPSVGTINYQVSPVPEALADNFSPAAYLQGKVDSSEDTMGNIWVNGVFEQEIFVTLGHEGFPGHMYQDFYERSQAFPTARYMLGNDGYTEGWATYVEKFVYEYMMEDAEKEEKDLIRLEQLNTEISHIMLCLLDIGIHYEGWSYDEYINQAKMMFGTNDEAMLKEQYNIFIETPGNYLSYYLMGMKYEDLLHYAQKELGDQFNTIEFHEAFLSCGTASYKIVSGQIQKYVKNNK